MMMMMTMMMMMFANRNYVTNDAAAFAKNI